MLILPVGPNDALPSDCRPVATWRTSTLQLQVESGRRQLPIARNVHFLTLAGDSTAGSRMFGCNPVEDIALLAI